MMNLLTLLSGYFVDFDSPNVDKNSKNWIRIIFLLKLPYKFCRMLLV